MNAYDLREVLRRDCVVSPAEQQTITETISRQGIRWLPFPYDNVVGLVSDIDACTSEKFKKYHFEIGQRFGLDFGDSFFLAQHINAPHGSFSNGSDDNDSTVGSVLGLALFGPNFQTMSHEFPFQPGAGRIRYTTRPLTNEIVKAFHEGKLDHFHTFLPQGPKVQLLNPVDRGFEVTFELPRQWPNPPLMSTLFQYFSAVGFQFSASRKVDARVVVYTDSSEHVYEGPIESGREVDLSRFDPAVECLNYNCISRISVATDDATAGFARAFLVNLSSAVLRRLIQKAVDEFGIQTSLLTGHAGFHFRTGQAQIKLDGRQADAVRGIDLGAESVALVGQVKNESGEVVVDTDADHPASVSRAIPDITESLGVSFLTPCGFVCLRRNSLPLLELLRPGECRDGTPTYLAGRVNTLTNRPDDDPIPAARSTADTLNEKLTAALDALEERRNHASPVYTHLGIHINKATQKDSLAGDLYFEGDALERSMISHFGLANGAPIKRNWFTRASTIYEYTYALMNIGQHLTRTENEIRLRSWVDQHTNKRWPRQISQLYGLTFYVEDSATAALKLEDEPIAFVGRNRADESGRESVTILESALRFYVDPIDDPHSECLPALSGPLKDEIRPLEGTAPDSRQYARRFQLAEDCHAPQTAVARWNLSGFDPRSGQNICFWVRKSTDADFCLRFVSVDGDAVAVGTPTALAATQQSMASYTIEPRSIDDHEWTPVAINLSNLTWHAAGSSQRVPPNRPIGELELILVGPQGSELELRELFYSRPKGIGSDPSHGYCLVGRVESPCANEQVAIAPRSNGAEIQLAIVDDRGLFCFTGLAPDHYDVGRLQPGDEATPPSELDGSQPVFLRGHRTDVSL